MSHTTHTCIFTRNWCNNRSQMCYCFSRDKCFINSSHDSLFLVFLRFFKKFYPYTFYMCHTSNINDYHKIHAKFSSNSSTLHLRKVRNDPPYLTRLICVNLLSFHTLQQECMHVACVQHTSCSFRETKLCSNILIPKSNFQLYSGTLIAW